MEKLILRGVMWGADKIPDSAFEKIPGGYYKPKPQADNKQDKDTNKSADMKGRRHSRRRRSNDDLDGEDRRGRRDRNVNDGYRSDGGQDRGADARQSHDGGDDDFDSINNRPRRQRSRVDLYRKDDRRRSQPHRSSVDGLFSYHDGLVEPPPNFEDPALPRGSPSSVPSSTQYPSSNHSSIPNGSIHSQQGGYPPPNAAHRSTSTLRGGLATGYVPYADIYGGPTYQAPPPSETGSVQPNDMNQVAPPIARGPVARQPYQQNPFAQEAPPGAQPAYMPDPHYNARRYERDEGFNDRRYDEDDSETERGYSRSPPRRRHSTRDGRSRHSDRARSQGIGKSGIRGVVDTSERGLGYSAVGALAGGLFGSELGKGLVPTAIGSALGAIGANAFQARERYVDPRAHSQKQSKPQPPRKKEEKRQAEYGRGRRDDGYYSD